MKTKPAKSRRPAPQSKATPAQLAAEIRTFLKTGGSSEHAAGVQWFFKDEIKSHGWDTANLRRAARSLRKEILKNHDFNFLVRVADKLFTGPVLEEKICAVFLLEKLDANAAMPNSSYSSRGWIASAVGPITTDSFTIEFRRWSPRIPR
jgi:hypothetical protein